MTEIENLEREIAEKQARLAELRAKEPDWLAAAEAARNKAHTLGFETMNATQAKAIVQAALPLAPVVGMSDTINRCDKCDAPLLIRSAFSNLLTHAESLRAAQRAYMANRGNEEMGREVARAAAALDEAIEAARALQ